MERWKVAEGQGQPWYVNPSCTLSSVDRVSAEEGMALLQTYHDGPVLLLHHGTGVAGRGSGSDVLFWLRPAVSAKRRYPGHHLLGGGGSNATDPTAALSAVASIYP